VVPQIVLSSYATSKNLHRYAKLDQTVALVAASSTACPGDSVTFTASGGDSTGSYVWGGAVSGTGASKTVTFSSTGSYTVSVYKAGDTQYNTSNTASKSVVVTKTPITPVITVSAGEIYTGDTAKITATISGGGNIPSGSLNGRTASLRIGSSVSTSATIANNTATFNVGSALAAGTYTITVSTTAYDPNLGCYSYTAASGSATLTVKARIATTFSFSGSPFTYDGTPKTLIVRPNPVNATYTTANITQTEPGSYTATATATGIYTGTQTMKG
jgi:hypothetical protein